jgi:Hypothetical protein (DUF2513)
MRRIMAQKCANSRSLQLHGLNANMKRDLDLIRELLLSIEGDPKYDGTREFYHPSPEAMGISGHSTEEVAYHLAQLIEAGSVDGAVSLAVPMQVIRKLTWNGREFLDNIRDTGIWTKTKERVSGLTTVGLTVVAEIAKAEIKKKLGLP